MHESQLETCRRFAAQFSPPRASEKLGISEGAMRDDRPLNGLRHAPEDGTSGWFIWSGEALSSDANFFRPLHLAHLEECCPSVLPYLALPPGWRFLITDGHEDAWFDEALLNPA
jgi:hypothetical protein